MTTPEWATAAQIKALQERATKEEGGRKEADRGLGTQLNAEEGKRYAGDTVLTERIATLEVKNSALEAKVAGLTKPEPKPEPTPEPPKPVEGTTIFNGSKISAFPEKIQAEAGRISEVPDPLGSGKTVLGLTVADSDVGKGNEPTNNPRSQLGTANLIKPGMEFELNTSILFPSNFPTWGSWMTLLSVYGEPYGGSGPFHLASYGKTIDWEEFWQGPPIVRGRYMPLRMRGLFEYNGYGEVEIDGHKSPRINGATRKKGVNDGGNNNVRLEQYRAKGTIPGTATLYFDGLKVTQL